MNPRRKFWSLIVVASMVAALLAGFVAWDQFAQANSQPLLYKLDTDTLDTFSHELGVDWHLSPGEKPPTVIDFGGGSTGAPAGLDQWFEEKGVTVQAAGVDADVLGAKKAVVLRVYFNDYANATRFSKTDVEGIVDSMNDLSEKTSYGKISVTREVSDLFQLPDDHDEYIDDLPPCEPDPAIQPLGDLSCGDKFHQSAGRRRRQCSSRGGLD